MKRRFERILKKNFYFFPVCYYIHEPILSALII